MKVRGRPTVGGLKGDPRGGTRDPYLYSARASGLGVGYGSRETAAAYTGEASEPASGLVDARLAAEHPFMVPWAVATTLINHS